MTVWLIETGTANTASMRTALTRLGAQVRTVTSPEHVDAAGRLVLPGVGSFAAAMTALRTQGLVEPLTRRIQAGLPTLAVCVGLQVLADASEESPGVAGLGIIPATVRRLPASRLPQLGWNRVGDADVSFANSFGLRQAPGFDVAWAEHGGRFVAAASRGNVLACQFHPELSSDAGVRWLSRWLAGEPPVLAGPTGRVANRIIPCLDIRNGRVVKGVQFQNLRDAGDPVQAAAAYQTQGADELVILDVSATPEGRANAAETVAAVRQVLGIPLTVGGGVRSVDDASRLLDAGADKVAVNTAAVRDPSLLTALSTRFGAQCTVLSLDAARSEAGFEVVVRSGTERTGDALEWVEQAVDRGVGEVLLTSWDRDGTGSGYDEPLIEAVRAAVGVPIIASGGADGPDTMARALRAGADAVLAASIFHDGVWTVSAVRDRLAQLGFPMRQP